MNANSTYDFAKIEEKNHFFVDLEIEEKEEDLIEKFDMTRLRSFSKIRNEKYEVIINILMKIGGFSEEYKRLLFHLEPHNIFYNTDGTVKIKNRDIREMTDYKEEILEKNFILEYKSIVCCALIGKYNFKDYIEGGEDLFSKDLTSTKIYECDSIEKIQECLDNLKLEYIHAEKKTKVTVDKKKNIALKIAAGVLAGCTLILGIYSGKMHFSEQPYKDAIIRADNAYIQGDDVKLINSLKKLSVDSLDKKHKYILALAYLHSENLSSKQKKNILKNVTLNSNDKYLEYWIQIGRLNIKEAQNLAMQMSDDELLLYSYLKEKAKIEDDTSLSGSSKSAKLKELETKIKEISDKYKKDDFSNETEGKAEPSANDGADQTVKEGTDNASPNN